MFQKKQSEKKRAMLWGDRLPRIQEAMNNPLTKATLLFLQSTQPTFDLMNVMLQSDEPQIHMLHHMCVDLLTNLYLKFLKIETIDPDDIFNVEYKKRENQKSTEGSSHWG